MTAPGFSPWTDDLHLTHGLDKRLELGQGQAVLSEADRVTSDPLAVLGTLLALRRRWSQTQALNPDVAEGREAGATHFAREVSAAIRGRLAHAGLDEEQVQAVKLELDWLDTAPAPENGGIAGGAEASPAPGEAFPEGPLLRGAYGAYARGLWHRGHGHAEGACEALSEALNRAAGDPEAERRISCALLPVLFEAGHDDRLIARGEALSKALSLSGRHLFDLGWAQHWMARGYERKHNWRLCVEAARESNLRFFQFGASQRSRWVGVNYFLVARGMAELEEWGEAAALAQLSLRALDFSPRYPGRADSLLLLARCLDAFDEDQSRADARGILGRLIEERPAVAGAEAFYHGAEALREKLGPGPVSPRRD